MAAKGLTRPRAWRKVTAIMKTTFQELLWRGWSAALVLVVGAGLVGAGCGKSEEETDAGSGDAAAAEAAPAEDQVVAEETEPQDESTTEAALVPMNVDETLRGTDQAMQSRDWSSATDALLKLQMSGSIQSDQQSWDYNKRMTQLQQSLIDAADNGDARAQAAIERLKRSRQVR